MKKLMKKIAIWFGWVEPTWWELVDAPPTMIRGRHLMDALNHRRA